MASKRERELMASAVDDAIGAPPEASPAAPEANGAPSEASAARSKRKKRRAGARPRDYWVCGRANPNDTWDRIMCFETVGRARKGLEIVRRMPSFRRHELRIEKCIVVA